MIKLHWSKLKVDTVNIWSLFNFTIYVESCKFMRLKLLIVVGNNSSITFVLPVLFTYSAPVTTVAASYLLICYLFPYRTRLASPEIGNERWVKTLKASLNCLVQPLTEIPDIELGLNGECKSKHNPKIPHHTIEHFRYLQ